jgi:Holliday junction resolvase RusA-like endonuclease
MTREAKRSKNNIGGRPSRSGKRKAAYRRTLYFGTKRTADWDNFHKLSCDALSGIAYADDSQVKRATVALAYDKARPRIELAISELA